MTRAAACRGACTVGAAVGAPVDSDDPVVVAPVVCLRPRVPVPVVLVLVVAMSLVIVGDCEVPLVPREPRDGEPVVGDLVFLGAGVDGTSGWVPADVPVGEPGVDVEVEPLVPFESAAAITGVDAISAPTPKATARAPTRPT